MPIKWKNGVDCRLVSDDGRFRIEAHWDQKPGYYELYEVVEGRNVWRARNTKLHSIKADAEGI